MKKITLLALATILSAAAFAQKNHDITGTVSEELNGKMAYLYDYNTQKSIDSSKVENGKFSFATKVEQPTICRVMFDGVDLFDDIIVENIPVEIQMGEMGITKLTSKGGLNEKYNTIVDLSATFNGRYLAHVDSLKKLYPDGQEVEGMFDLMSAELMPIYQNIFVVLGEQMKVNTDNAYGVYCVWKLADTAEDLKALDSLLAIVPTAKEFAPLKSKRDKLQLASATGAGEMFKDFDAQTVDGKPTKLSDYVGKGKYVLVDFWASWCGPCMQEVPNLKYIHETYPDLVVLGVNVWDKHDKFLEAIKKEQMTWTCIYASENKTATELYGILGIPTIILFAPDGTIVDRTLRGEAMKAFIADLFKK